MRFNVLLIIISLTMFGCAKESETEVTMSGSDPGAMGEGSGEHDHEHGAGDAHDHGGFELTADNTQVLFTGTKKSGDNHSGGFKAVAGKIEVAEGAVTSLNVVIQTDSLFSDDERLTGHLKNEDFFSVAEFPEMKFESTKIEGAGEVTVTGNLTMHGTTAEVSFPATVTVEGESVKLTSEFKVDRTKFGMNYVGKPDDPINAEVDIKVIVGG